MNFNAMFILDKLLSEQQCEREICLFSLGYWSDEIQFSNSEEEVSSIFQLVLNELIKLLGEPVYSGTYYKDVTEPETNFDSTPSALQIAWWESYNGEVALFHTTHDAGSLQFVVLAISDGCTKIVA